MKMIKKIIKMLKKKDNRDLWREIEYPPQEAFKILGFIPIRIALLTIVILFEIISISFLSEKFNGFIFQLLFLFLLFYAPYKTVKYYKLIKKIIQEGNNNGIKDRIIYMIHTNKLYDEEVFEIKVRDKNGNIKIDKEKRVVRSVKIYYCEDDDNVYIRVAKLGDRFTKIANELGSNLESAISYKLDSFSETINYCEYVFKKKEDTRIIMKNSDIVAFNNSDELFLTEQLSFALHSNPHILIGGVTGGGKSTLINYFIIELLKMKSTIYVLDNKNSDLASLKQYLGNEFVGSSANESAKITRLVREEMEYRFKTYKENPNNFIYGGNFLDYHLNPVVLIVDELGALRASADKKVFSEIISNLTSIVLKGREMGVFVILSTQQANSSNIPTELRDNLSVRISLGNLSDEGYRMVFGEIPDETVQNVGEGYIFLDGKGFTKPKKIEFPYVNYKKFKFIDEIQKLISEIKKEGNYPCH